MKRCPCGQDPDDHRMVVTSANHWDLLSRDDVYQQLRAWLHTEG